MCTGRFSLVTLFGSQNFSWNKLKRLITFYNYVYAKDDQIFKVFTKIRFGWKKKM